MSKIYTVLQKLKEREREIENRENWKVVPFKWICMSTGQSVSTTQTTNSTQSPISRYGRERYTQFYGGGPEKFRFLDPKVRDQNRLQQLQLSKGKLFSTQYYSFTTFPIFIWWIMLNSGLFSVNGQEYNIRYKIISVTGF